MYNKAYYLCNKLAFNTVSNVVIQSQILILHIVVWHCMHAVAGTASPVLLLLVSSDCGNRPNRMLLQPRSDEDSDIKIPSGEIERHTAQAMGVMVPESTDMAGNVTATSILQSAVKSQFLLLHVEVRHRAGQGHRQLLFWRRK
jgi:hypothetical protein